MVGVKRVEGKTPSGGDYAVLFFLDDDGNPVEQKKATRTIAQEYTYDGTLKNTTYAYLNQNNTK